MPVYFLLVLSSFVGYFPTTLNSTPFHLLLDTNPPDIEFEGDLPSFSKKTMPFSWRATEDSQFECALDDMANFAPCGRGMTGSQRLRDLTEGRHTFYVRAKDQLDNVGRPISHTWTVGKPAEQDHKSIVWKIFCALY